jgi:hypothetical protein
MEEACCLTLLPLLQVFWRLWSLSTTLHCSTCNQWFSAIQVRLRRLIPKLKSRFDRLTAAQLNNCLHHSVEPQVSPFLALAFIFQPPFLFLLPQLPVLSLFNCPQFTLGNNIGLYPCCGAQTLRLSSTWQSNHTHPVLPPHQHRIPLSNPQLLHPIISSASCRVNPNPPTLHLNHCPFARFDAARPATSSGCCAKVSCAPQPMATIKISRPSPAVRRMRRTT